MPTITISGVENRVDGSYYLDLDDGFTYQENHLIKQISGVRALEMGDALAAGDTDIIVALAKIALDRNGRDDVSVDVLMQAKATSIQFGPTDAEQAAEEEAAQLPLPNVPTSPSEPKSETSTSGGSTSNGSDILPESGLPVIGVQA